MELIGLPPGFSVQSVMWQEDRHAFCIFVQSPTLTEFFVPQNEVIPVQAAAVTVTDEGNGERRIRIALPQLDDLMAVLVGQVEESDAKG